MKRNRAPSPATRATLGCLLDAAQGLHGYEISRRTGIQAGTLYPMLIRLADQGLLTAQWIASEVPGRPPRHLYALTETGRAVARQLASEAQGAGTLDQWVRS